MRTFVAINIPAAERAALHASLAPIRERQIPVRWTDPDALHLTLKFLGEIDGSEIAALDAALRDVAARHAQLDMDIGGFGAFPSLRRATVLWVGIAAEPRLMALQRDTELALSRLGYPREQRPFRPHITIARLHGGGRPADVQRLAGMNDYSSRVTVTSIDLMRSQLSPAGARYDVLMRATLGAGTGTPAAPADGEAP
ncbi:MAG TPA: RNA 2',3'-cyclic phosphodiesterase [Longimicrobiales bacterium]|nr:RNA 2',3'-cyclic phosphodiesterase [Longimicrobiales bacterium]